MKDFVVALEVLRIEEAKRRYDDAGRLLVDIKVDRDGLFYLETHFT